MLGQVAGAALGAAASIFGGIKASKAVRRVKQDLENQRNENKQWYERRYNEDSTQRADAQRILTQTEEAFRNRNKQAAGIAAVMGGTEESVAATKQANAQGLAEATSQIAVAGDNRKDAVEQQYRSTDTNIRGQINGMNMQKAAAIGQAAAGVGDAVSSWGTAYEGAASAARTDKADKDTKTE